MEFQFIPMTKVIESTKDQDLPEIPEKFKGLDESVRKAKTDSEKMFKAFQDIRDGLETLEKCVDDFNKFFYVEKVNTLEGEIEEDVPDLDNEGEKEKGIRPLRASVKDFKTAAIVDEVTAEQLKEEGYLVLEVEGGVSSKLQVWFTDLGEQEAAPQYAWKSHEEAKRKLNQNEDSNEGS